MFVVAATLMVAAGCVDDADQTDQQPEVETEAGNIEEAAGEEVSAEEARSNGNTKKSNTTTVETPATQAETE